MRGQEDKVSTHLIFAKGVRGERAHCTLRSYTGRLLFQAMKSSVPKWLTLPLSCAHEHPMLPARCSCKGHSLGQHGARSALSFTMLDWQKAKPMGKEIKKIEGEEKSFQAVVRLPAA